MDRAEAVAEFKRVFKILNDDLNSIQQTASDGSSDFLMRSLVRAFFAFVEGIAYQLRQVAIISLEGTTILTEGEMSVLREEKFQLNKSGNPESKEDFQPMLPILLFSIKTYAKIHGANFEPDVSDHGWNAMRKAVAIRHRLTHPKSTLDLALDATDHENIALGSKWWIKTLEAMFLACDEADEFYSKM